MARWQLSTQDAGSIFKIFSAETATSAKAANLGSARNMSKLVMGVTSFDLLLSC